MVEQIFADPVINVPTASPCLSSSSSSFSSSSSSSNPVACNNLIPTGNISLTRKSRDESLGYGSLSDSESNVCQSSSELPPPPPSPVQSLNNSGETGSSGSENGEPLKPKVLNQSKLYIKEYQSLRFDKACIYVEDPRDMHLKSIDIIDTSVCKKKSTQSSASSGFGDDDDDLIQDLFESKHVPGFGETTCPALIVNRRHPVNESKFSALSSEPVISDMYLKHFALQGIMLKSDTSLQDILKTQPCKCSEKANIVIHGNIDVWSVNITSLKTKSVVPAMMCTQIGQICESLVALDAIEMKSEFILGYLESKLNELKLRSKILQALQTDRCPLSIKTQSFLSLTDSNGVFDLGPDIISPVLGFDVSDLPLLSVMCQSSGIRCNKVVQHAETSL